MPSPKAPELRPLVLVCGDDEFAVKQRARQVYQQWGGNGNGLDNEIIDASVSNSGEALSALAKLREALQTFPFFGGTKVIWLQNCNFLGDERTASSQAVTENLAALAQELKALPWDNLRLLISAGKVDKRKVFYKSLEKAGTVEVLTGWSADDRDWAAGAEETVSKQLRSLKKEISIEAQSKLVASVGPNSRQLFMETEKLATYVGDRCRIEAEDVDAITTRNRQSRAFALGDAFGERNLPKLLRILEDDFAEMKRDAQKSEIGLLYGLISKVRVMIFLREMQRAGWIRQDSDYNRFKQQLERIPPQSLPEDRRFNPLAMNPYVLYKALAHARRYSLEELTGAMQALLECNRRLIFSNLDGTMVLQQTLLKIIGRTEVGRVT